MPAAASPPATPSGGTVRSSRVSGAPSAPPLPRLPRAAGEDEEPPAPPPPPAVNGRRGTLPAAGSGGRPLADAAEQRPMGSGCQRSRARRAGGVQG